MARPRPLAEQCLRSIVFCFFPKRELPSLPQPIQRVIIRGFTHPPRSNKSHNDPVHQQVGSFASDSGPPWLDRLRTLTDIWCALAKQAATFTRPTLVGRTIVRGKQRTRGEFGQRMLNSVVTQLHRHPSVHLPAFTFSDSAEASRQAPPSGCRLKHRESLSQPVPISYLPKGIAALTTSKASSDGNVARKLRNQQNSLALTCVAPRCS